jgi:two-component system sensor histidine kinase TctE
MPDVSLRGTLTRRLIWPLAVTVLLALLGVYALGSRYINLAYDRALFDDVATIAAQVEQSDGRIRFGLPRSALELLLAAESDQVLYRVIDLNAGALVDGNGDLQAWDERPLVDGQPYFRDVRVAGERYRVAYTRRTLEPGDRAALVEVGETLGKRNRAQREIMAGAAGLMLLLVGGFVLVLRQGLFAALAPLARLELEAARRSGDNLAPLDPMLAPREARGLIEAINRMMGRVSHAIESQRRFVSNASHQLRTPLAGLRLQAQIALKSDAPAPVIACLREIETSAARASHLIDQLLVLSAAEAEDFASLLGPVDLARLAQATIERHMGQALRCAAVLDYDGPADGPVVRGNAVLLAEAVSNLVDNALRYNQPGGRATVMVTRQGDHACIGVDDDGPGLPGDGTGEGIGEGTGLFTRFHRGDSARSAGAGAGLGLAIVKEIAERHGGQLDWRSQAGRGTRILIRMPAG